MTSPSNPVRAVDAPNQFVDLGDRRLAYRSIGSGKPIVLCAFAATWTRGTPRSSTRWPPAACA